MEFIARTIIDSHKHTHTNTNTQPHTHSHIHQMARTYRFVIDGKFTILPHCDGATWAFLIVRWSHCCSHFISHYVRFVWDAFCVCASIVLSSNRNYSSNANWQHIEFIRNASLSPFSFCIFTTTKRDRFKYSVYTEMYVVCLSNELTWLLSYLFFFLWYK